MTTEEESFDLPAQVWCSFAGQWPEELNENRQSLFDLGRCSRLSDIVLRQAVPIDNGDGWVLVALFT